MNKYIVGGVLGGLGDIAKTFANVKMMQYQKAENKKNRGLNYLKSIAPKLQDERQLKEIATAFGIPDKEISIFKPLIGTDVNTTITPALLQQIYEIRKKDPEAAKVVVGNIALHSKNPTGVYKILESISTPEDVKRYEEIRKNAFTNIPNISPQLASPLIETLHENGIISDQEKNYLDSIAGTRYRPPEYMTKKRIDIWKTNPEFAKELKLPKGTKLTADQYITKLTSWTKAKEAKYKGKRDYWKNVYKIRKDAFTSFMNQFVDKQTGEILDDDLKKYNEYFKNPENFDSDEVAKIMTSPVVRKYIELKKNLEQARKNIVQTMPEGMNEEYQKMFEPLIKAGQRLLEETK